MLVAGEVSAIEENLFEYSASAPVITGIVTPAPTISFNGALACGP